MVYGVELGLKIKFSGRAQLCTMDGFPPHPGAPGIWRGWRDTQILLGLGKATSGASAP